jgi:hypothetical protein
MDRGILFAATNPEVRKKCGDHRYTPPKIGPPPIPRPGVHRLHVADVPFQKAPLAVAKIKLPHPDEGLGKPHFPHRRQVLEKALPQHSNCVSGYWGAMFSRWAIRRSRTRTAIEEIADRVNEEIDGNPINASVCLTGKIREMVLFSEGMLAVKLPALMIV